MHKFFQDKRPHNGLTYEEYIKEARNKLESNSDNSTDELLAYTKLNIHRSNRIEKTYNVSDELCSLVKNINTPQIWMVITEDWCGDSAQNLPYIVKIASCNSLINLRIIRRDGNLDIMDQYLTNGKSRSIPKLVAFDEDGNELFQWGPRPKEAKDFVDKAKEDGIPKSEFIEKLHLWYANNKGQSIEKEFKKLLSNLH